MIHPGAFIHPQAQLDPSVVVGPGAVIDAGVIVGPDCVVGPLVHLTGHTTIGTGNRFHAGCVIGDAPQDLKYPGTPTRLRIGDRNVFREHVTVHRSSRLEDETVLGSDNFLMVHCHVGHNCVLGDHVTMANGATLGGHVVVQDRAFLSGNCLVHQFVRVGTLALMQGGSAISKDLPPYVIARGDNDICGLNIIGLRRAGLGPEDRLELKRLYHLLFRGEGTLRAAAAAAPAEFTRPASRTLLEFIAASRRGILVPRGGRGTAASPEPADGGA